MRALARFLSLVLLVCAVMAGVLDSIQSVAASQVVLTPLGVTIASLNADILPQLADLSKARLPGWVWDPFAVFVLNQPAFGVLLVLALLFWMVGYRRPAPSGLAAL